MLGHNYPLRGFMRLRTPLEALWLRVLHFKFSDTRAKGQVCAL